MRLLQQKWFMGIVFMCLSPLGLAESVPSNCQVDGFEYYNDKLYLNAVNYQTKQRLFLIRNTTPQPVVVSHKDENEFIDLGWEVALETGKWSALAVDGSHYGVLCQVNGQTVSCEEVLEVCEFPDVKFDLSSQGSYWVAENTELRSIYRQAGSKGVRLHRWW